MIHNIDRDYTIKKEFRALSEEDWGEIHEIANGHVLVQRCVIDKKISHFSKTKQKVMTVSFS